MPAAAERAAPSAIGAPLSVTAVVVTWNSARDIEACLDALRGQDHPALDVVVVDNGSTDGTLELLAAAGEAGAPLRVLRQGRNTGFCAAVNRGIAASEAEAVLLVNPDTVLAPDHARVLATALAHDPGLGSVQGTLWRPDGTVDSTGHRAFTSRLFDNRDEGRTRTSAGGEVFGVTGAAALHRRAMLDDVAVPRDDGTPEWLDETLFAYWDDVDLDWRARLRGWRAAHVPAAVGRHVRAGADAEARPDVVEECNAANRLLVVAKLDDRWDLLRHAPMVVLGTALKLAWLALVRPRCLPGVARRLRAGWAPTMRRRRWALSHAVVPPAALVARFEPFSLRRWVGRWWHRRTV